VRHYPLYDHVVKLLRDNLEYRTKKSLPKEGQINHTGSILKEIRHHFFAIVIIDAGGSRWCFFVGVRDHIPRKIPDHTIVELYREKIRRVHAQEGADSFEFPVGRSLVPAQLCEGGLSEDIPTGFLFCPLDAIRGIPLIFEHLVHINIGSQNNLNHFDHLLAMIVAQK
jgi:hypothetical protein